MTSLERGCGNAVLVRRTRRWPSLTRMPSEPFFHPEIDKLLDQARVEADQAKRDELYRKIQKLYAEKPAMLQLVYVDHVYVERDRGYTHPDAILEPHAHGLNE